MLKYVVDFVKTSLECVCAAVVLGVVIAIFFTTVFVTCAWIYKLFFV